MIHNPTGFPHVWCQKMGGMGQIFDVLAIRGTFDIVDGVPVHPALTQEPPLLGDELEGAENAPLTAVVRRAGDLVVHKPSTDIHVIGTACSEGVSARPHWLAGVSVGDTVKVLRLSGPRQFRLGLWDWRLTKPEPMNSVVLGYRHAFGGCFHGATEGGTCYKLDNPAGCGWLPDRKILSLLDKPTRRDIEQQILAVRQLDAPQIDDPREPVSHPQQQMATRGFGPIARWCMPRVGHLGTRDEQWLSEQYPEYPDDFDSRFFQNAHPDLICPRHLAGDEPVVLVGLLPEGSVRTSLPSVAFRIDAIGDDGRGTTHRPMLDTVCIDLDTRTIALTWRLTFPVDVHVRDAWIRLETLGAQAQRMEAA